MSPRATRHQPELIRILVENTLFFNIFKFGLSLRSDKKKEEAGQEGYSCDPADTRVSGMQKADARFAVAVRGSVETGRGAHGTHPHIFERHKPGDAVATKNHFRHVQGAKMRMPRYSEGKAQQLSRTGKAG